MALTDAWPYAADAPANVLRSVTSTSGRRVASHADWSPWPQVEAAFAPLTNLRKLHLSAPHLTNVDGLSGLTNLRSGHLNLFDAPIPMKNIKALAQQLKIEIHCRRRTVRP